MYNAQLDKQATNLVWHPSNPLGLLSSSGRQKKVRPAQPFVLQQHWPCMHPHR